MLLSNLIPEFSSRHGRSKTSELGLKESIIAAVTARLELKKRFWLRASLTPARAKTILFLRFQIAYDFKIAKELGPPMVREVYHRNIVVLPGTRCKIGYFFRYVIMEGLSKPLNLRRCVEKVAKFENYSSFHEHGSAFWQLKSATFRFALIVESNFTIC